MRQMCGIFLQAQHSLLSADGAAVTSTNQQRVLTRCVATSAGNGKIQGIFLQAQHSLFSADGATVTSTTNRGC